MPGPCWSGIRFLRSKNRDLAAWFLGEEITRLFWVPQSWFLTCVKKHILRVWEFPKKIPFHLVLIFFVLPLISNLRGTYSRLMKKSCVVRTFYLYLRGGGKLRALGASAKTRLGQWRYFGSYHWTGIRQGDEVGILKSWGRWVCEFGGPQFYLPVCGVKSYQDPSTLCRFFPPPTDFF